MKNLNGLLSEDNCRHILKKHSTSVDAELVGYVIEPLANSLDGLIGEQFTVTIMYKQSGKQNEFTAFFKLLNGKSSTMFALAKDIKAFEKESFFYETLVPKFSEHDIDMSFAPEYYLCFPYTVVLEDLSVHGFRSAGKSKLLDMEKCRQSMKVLAKFHTSSILYEKKKSDELGKAYKLVDEYPEMLVDVLFSGEENSASKWLKCSIEGLFKIIDLLPESAESREKFKAKLKSALEAILSEKPDDMKCGILHGDLWANNFLYRSEKACETEAKLIDFQSIKYGPVALDVEQFIMTNTRKLFRDNHEDALLDDYFASFSEIVKHHGCEPSEVLSKEDFITSCRTMKLPAKIQAIVDRSTTFMSDEIFLEVMKDEEQFSRFLFADRGKYIVESYTENDQFRELILEDMLELRDLLFSD